MAVSRTTEQQEQALRRAVATPKPVWTRSPSADAFFPLVLLIAVLTPGLVAWIHGALTPAAAGWGQFGLDVLDGDWLLPGPFGQPAPPMVVWSDALFLAIPGFDKLLAILAPSYVYAVLSLGCVYLVGRWWFSSGTGVLATLVVGLNPLFLMQVRTGEPSLAVLFWFLLSLLVYIHHLLNEEETFSVWTIVGAFGFGALLLTAGFNAFWAPVIGVANVFFRELGRQESKAKALKALFASPTTRAGALVVSMGLLVAAPWILASGLAPGPWAPWTDPAGDRRDLSFPLGDLIAAMPATIVLAGFGMGRSFLRAVRGNRNAGKPAFILIWSVVSLTLLLLTMRTVAGLLLTIAPLSFFAVRTLVTILRRELRDRVVCGLMLATGWVFLLGLAPGLSSLSIWHWPAGPFLAAPARWWEQVTHLEASEWLALHFALDLVVVVAAVVICLYVLARRQDRYRRYLFGGFAITVVLLVAWSARAPFLTPYRRADPWLRIYHQLAKSGPIDQLIMVDPEQPRPELVFISRLVFPSSPPTIIQHREQLDDLVADPRLVSLVLVAAPTERWPRIYPITRGETTITLAQFIDSADLRGYRTSAPTP